MKSVFNMSSFLKTPLFLFLFSFTVSAVLAEVKAPETVTQYADKELESPIQLTEEEQAWLDRRHTVRVRIGNAPPYHMTTPEPHGISVDYLRVIGKRFGINFSFVKTGSTTWQEAIDDLIGERKLFDLLITMKRTQEREKQIAFTQDYLSSPWVIVNRTDSDFVSQVQDLKGKKVAVESGYIIKDLIEKEYPQIRIVPFKTSLDALQSVATGGSDAYIANLTMASYLIQSKGLNNLKIAAPTPFGSHDQAMGVRKDWPELASIIKKALMAMTEAEKSEILNHWFKIRYEYGVNIKKVLIWVAGLTAVCSLIITVIFIWNSRLRREINNRIMAEEALKKSEALLESTGKIANIGGWEFDGKSKGLRWTEEVYRIHEVDSDFIPSVQTTIDFYASEDRPIISQALQRAIEHGESFDLELPIITAKGNRRVIRTLGEAQSRDGINKIVLGTFQDITERKQADAALTASEIRYRGLFESAKEGILILEAETGMVLDVNPYLIKLLSFSREQFLGKKIWELGFFKDLVANQDNFSELQRKEYIRYEDLALETSDGQRIQVEFISNVSLVNYQKVIQCSIRDITERKQAEDALRQKAEALRASNAELEIFNSAMVGRELRMIELKEEIDELCRRLGETPRHATGQLETDRVSGAGMTSAKPDGGGA